MHHNAVTSEFGSGFAERPVLERRGGGVGGVPVGLGEVDVVGLEEVDGLVVGFGGGLRSM